MEELVTISYLPTKQDCADFHAAVCAFSANPWEKMLLHGSGLLLAALTAVFWAMDVKTVQNSLRYSIMMLAALFIGFFQDLIQPFFVRMRAQKYYEVRKDRMISQTIVFYKEELKYQTDRYNAQFSYDFLYKAYENESVFLIYTAANEIKYIPKRAVSAQESEQIRRILKENLNERFQQEGAR